MSDGRWYVRQPWFEAHLAYACSEHERVRRTVRYQHTWRMAPADQFRDQELVRLPGAARLDDLEA